MTDEFIIGGQQKVVSAKSPPRSNIVPSSPITTKSPIKVWVVVGAEDYNEVVYVLGVYANKPKETEKELATMLSNNKEGGYIDVYFVEVELDALYKVQRFS